MSVCSLAPSSSDHRAQKFEELLHEIDQLLELAAIDSESEDPTETQSLPI
jgi:hypothetical protein